MWSWPHLFQYTPVSWPLSYPLVFQAFFKHFQIPTFIFPIAPPLLPHMQIQTPTGFHKSKKTFSWTCHPSFYSISPSTNTFLKVWSLSTAYTFIGFYGRYTIKPIFYSQIYKIISSDFISPYDLLAFNDVDQILFFGNTLYMDFLISLNSSSFPICWLLSLLIS